MQHYHKKVSTFRNRPHWLPSLDDYQLIFVEVDGHWIELGHDIPQFSNIEFCEYLTIMGIQNIPDYTQFLRIIHPDYYLEYRCFGGRIRIDYHKREVFNGY